MPKKEPLSLPSGIEGEVWKQFHPNYYISNMGRVYSIYKKVVILPEKNNWGYYRFKIITAKKRHWMFAHCLVVKAFGDVNGNYFPEGEINRRKINIDHLDFNKANNAQSNLEIVTALENNLRKLRKMVAERQRKELETCAKTAQTHI